MTNTSDAPMATLVFARVVGPEGGPLAAALGQRRAPAAPADHAGRGDPLPGGRTRPAHRHERHPAPSVWAGPTHVRNSRRRASSCSTPTVWWRAATARSTSAWPSSATTPDSRPRRLEGRTIDEYCDELLDRIAPRRRRRRPARPAPARRRRRRSRGHRTASTAPVRAQRGHPGPGRSRLPPPAARSAGPDTRRPGRVEGGRVAGRGGAGTRSRARPAPPTRPAACCVRWLSGCVRPRARPAPPYSSGGVLRAVAERVRSTTCARPAPPTRPAACRVRVAERVRSTSVGRGGSRRVPRRPSHPPARRTAGPPTHGGRCPSAPLCDGVDIFYKDWGRGRPVVFIHGWPLNGDAWQDQLKAVADAGYRGIAHDRRGHGCSTPVYDGYRLRHLRRRPARPDHRPRPARRHLVAHSMGGGRAGPIHRLARGTERVRSVVLLSAITPLMLRGPDNPEGVPQSVFDGLKAGIIEERSQFWQDTAVGFFSADRDGSQVTRGNKDASGTWRWRRPSRAASTAWTRSAPPTSTRT
ncbi:alpha/beta fold hydrolase [Streptomyces thinghirensis]|nr:alpha/beta fold hydrolase [Streptomyces thinghirensis]